MEFKEEMVSQETVYEGVIVNVRRDKARLMDGRITNREVVEHPGGVAVFAMDDQGRVALVRQYRYAVGEHLWEIPAGKREKGEEPRITARRELHEEVGADAERWTDLGTLIASPGCYAERLYLYKAEGLTFTRQQLDEDEFLEVRFFPFEEVVEKCLSGQLQDAKTVAAVLKAKVLQENPCALEAFPLH